MLVFFMIFEYGFVFVLGFTDFFFFKFIIIIIIIYLFFFVVHDAIIDSIIEC